MNKWQRVVTASLTVGFTLFMLGKTDTEVVGISELQSDVEQHAQAIHEKRTDTKIVDKITGQYIDTLEKINHIEDSQTLYNRLLRPAIYYDEVEWQEAQQLLEQLETQQQQFVASLLPSQIDFQQIVDGTIKDEQITVEQRLGKTMIHIDGTVRTHPQQGLYGLYYAIYTDQATYYWREPDFTTANYTSNQIQIQGDIDYVMTMTKPTHAW